MAALAIAQDELGWLSKEAMEKLATIWACRRSPFMKSRRSTACTTSSRSAATRSRSVPICRARCLAQHAAQHLKQRLGIGFNETTADGAFTLKEGECFGACGDAPVLLVNNKRMESFMSNEKLDALLSELELAKR